MQHTVPVRARALLLALAAGIALADGSIVTLALPQLLTELSTTVEGVAAVIGVYTLILAVALPLAELARARMGTRQAAALGAERLALRPNSPDARRAVARWPIPA